ncbi:CYTH domain-containing protein [Chryseobacterium phage MA9V-2]|nr:CYTH domain-containing protein [Chryseobacterium phage MA9V-2]
MSEIKKYPKGLEKERRFLLKEDQFDPTIFHNKKFIQQAYLSVDNESGNNTRLRIEDWAKATITHKHIVDAQTRQEFDFDVDLSKASELFAKSTWKLEKMRYSKLIMQHGGQVNGELVVDFYPDGTAVVEIEYFDEWLYNLHQAYDGRNLPDLCGKEITGLKAFSNITLAAMMENQQFDHNAALPAI